MQLFDSIKSIRLEIQKHKRSQKKIGLVPTMGALHHGHINLIKKSVADNDITIASIFVNPTQFNDPKDLEKYPRTLESDSKLLEESSCDIIFFPNSKEMYPSKSLTKISFGSLEKDMEGKFRPGHFAGVGLVVSKLLNIICPDNAYFGQKDWQQYVVIKQLAEDLNFNTSIKWVETVREDNGLAMSSRNQHLSEKEKNNASFIYHSLKLAKAELLKGTSVEAVKKKITDLFEKQKELQLEYFNISDAFSLKNIKRLNETTTIVLSIAAFLNGVRLIDNILIET